jgi:hypothetical protein
MASVGLESQPWHENQPFNFRTHSGDLNSKPVSFSDIDCIKKIAYFWITGQLSLSLSAEKELEDIWC